MREKESENQLRRFFWYLNRYLMVPMFRLGLGPLMGTPFSGYIMVLKTVGRKSGKVRYSPVNYAIANGHVYCLAGFGKGADWYRNLKANPSVELIMPGGAVFGIAEEVTDPDEALVVEKQILKNGGFAGFLFGGLNPWTASDAELQSKIGDAILIRIRPNGIGSGASDPGGWAWIAVISLTVLWLFSGKRHKGK